MTKNLRINFLRAWAKVLLLNDSWKIFFLLRKLKKLTILSDRLLVNKLIMNWIVPEKLCFRILLKSLGFFINLMFRKVLKFPLGSLIKFQYKFIL